MRQPAGLDAAGKRLWKSVVDVFDLTDEPHKVQVLTQACRVADIIAELDEHAAEAPLTVKGSQGQPVIQPTLSEARFQRALLAQLLGRLGLPDNDADEAEVERKARRSAAGRTAAKARWDRGY
jgi:hypothetical protein